MPAILALSVHIALPEAAVAAEASCSHGLVHVQFLSGSIRTVGSDATNDYTSRQQQDRTCVGLAGMRSSGQQVLVTNP